MEPVPPDGLFLLRRLLVYFCSGAYSGISCPVRGVQESRFRSVPVNLASPIEQNKPRQPCHLLSGCRASPLHRQNRAAMDLINSIQIKPEFRQNSGGGQDKEPVPSAPSTSNS